MPTLASSTRHRLCCWLSAALLVIVEGCGRFWSPTPPPPTAEQVAALRDAQVAQQANSKAAAAQAQKDSGRERAARPPTLRPFWDWSMPETAADALSRIGAAAVPGLVDALRSTDSEMRRRAVTTLGRIGPDAAGAVPALVALLNDPDPRVSLAAARALGQIGPHAAPAVPALIQRLEGSP